MKIRMRYDWEKNNLIETLIIILTIYCILIMMIYLVAYVFQAPITWIIIRATSICLLLPILLFKIDR